MARRRGNLGGFSWKRLTGVTRAKQSLSRKTGIPWSRSGRQRKIGKAMGGCLVSVIFFVMVGIAPVFGYVLNTSTKKIHADHCLEIEKMNESNYQYSDTKSVPGYTLCLKCFANDGTIRPPTQPGVRPVVPPLPAARPVVPTVVLPVPSSAGQRSEIPAPNTQSWRPGMALPSTQVAPQEKSKDAEKSPLRWGWLEVERVVDGDTLLLKNGHRVRLTGVDTPETVNPGTPIQPFGKEATEYTKAFILLGENWIFLEEDGDQKDKYDRQLGMVYVRIHPFGEPDESKIFLLNDMLVKSGLAKAQTQYRYSQEMKDKFVKSEKEARERKVGMWSQAL